MSNRNDNNNSYFNSSYKTFSKVCRSDPENPGRMICKEVGDDNGKKVEKEYFKELPGYSSQQKNHYLNTSNFTDRNYNNHTNQNEEGMFRRL